MGSEKCFAAAERAAADLCAAIAAEFLPSAADGEEADS